MTADELRRLADNGTVDAFLSTTVYNLCLVVADLAERVDEVAELSTRRYDELTRKVEALEKHIHYTEHQDYVGLPVLPRDSNE